MTPIEEVQAKIDEVEARIAELMQDTGLSLDQQDELIEPLEKSLRKLDRAERQLAAGLIGAQAAKVRDLALSASENALRKVAQGLSGTARGTAAAIMELVREMTPTPAAAPPPVSPRPQAIVDPVSEDPVLMRRTHNHKVVYGHLVREMQVALRAPEFDPKGADMFFGPDTETALRRWLIAQGRKRPQVFLTFQDWRDLTGLPDPDLFDLCAQLVAAFEGHGFTQARGNWDGAICTWGYHGYTLKWGHMQGVLAATENESPGILREVLTDGRGEALLHMLGLPLEQQRDWGLANLLTPDGKMKTEWVQDLDRLGATPACRNAQLSYSRRTFWEAKAVPHAERLGLADPLSLCMLFDAEIHQGGPTGATLRRVEDFRRDHPDADEMQVREVLAQALVDQIGDGRFREDAASRRTLFIDGRGRVHQGNYDLNYWGFHASVDENEGMIAELSQPAVVPATVVAVPASFHDFYKARLRPIAPRFSAAEFLSKGAKHGGGGPCAGLNADPPQDLWENVVELARVLQKIRDHVNVGILVTNVYRSPAYNRCIKGATRSQHLQFNAADIIIQDGGSGFDWHQKVVRLRNEGLFKGGIGRYSGFVHVDTRGRNADWG